MAGRERDDGSFLSRWSERKREAKQSEDEARTEAAEEAAAHSGMPADAAQAEAFDPNDLPDIDTLDKESDFSVFMHTKVPEALRRRALRRLWKVDPTFAFRDGMNDYDEDYTDAALVVEGLKTAYQVGKGMVRPEEPEEEHPQEGGPQEEQPEEGEDAEALSAAEDEGAPESVSEVEQGAQQATEDVSDSAVVDGNKLLPAIPEEAESTLDIAAARPVSKPAGSALRRRWGDQSG